ncbi:hypothetical protein [Solidesulfovibrio fructosivorans]|uniref:hypothetical protein n=1 Tax=Solidesulfovibrio fructosivorans TaxID=878 RepID=UPI00117DF792|nr:hypothetical protein [Solidesulfovibrio fructosivorans]
MRNIESRLKRLEEDGLKETCMVIKHYNGETKKQAMERYYEEHPHMRAYDGHCPFILLETFRDERHA